MPKVKFVKIVKPKTYYVVGDEVCVEVMVESRWRAWGGDFGNFFAWGFAWGGFAWGCETGVSRENKDILTKLKPSLR